MRHLATAIHPSLGDLKNLSILHRSASRGIAIKGNQILLLHTERYEDYSLPGGGIEPGEDKVEGLVREMQEETGAQNIRDIKPFGIYEEYRPWYKPEVDVVHMVSYCYTCQVDDVLGPTHLESYEKRNGMRPLWVDIERALNHNIQTLKSSDKKGLSIEREIYLLRRITEELC